MIMKEQEMGVLWLLEFNRVIALVTCLPVKGESHVEEMAIMFWTNKKPIAE
jgi:hypothetical protein